MEGVLSGQQQQQQRQQEKNKELQQQEETQATMNQDKLYDGGRLQLPLSEVQGSSRRPPREQGGITVQSNGADVEVVTIDSDDSTELREPGLSRKSIQTLWPALEEAQSGLFGRYSGRLRRPTAKKCNWDVLFTCEELGSSDDCFKESEKSVVKQLRNTKPRSNWGRKKHRTDRWSAREARQVRSLSKSTQETQNRNLQDYGSAKVSQEGMTEWVRGQRKNLSDSRGAPVRESAQARCEISCEEHRRRSLLEGNAVAGWRTVPPGSPLSSLGRLESSCKRNQFFRGSNMVTQIESFPRELGGLHEGPATPMKPPIRKRKAGVLADEIPEAHGLDTLSNRRARSDGTERAVQQQYYQLSSDGEEATEYPGFALAGLYEQTPPPSANLPFDTLQPDQLDAFLNGEYAKEDPRFDNLDAFATGALYRPATLVNGSQFDSGREFSPFVPLNNLDADIDALRTSYSQGEGGVFSATDRGAFNIASEPITNDSLETAQSDEDYHPPAGYSAFQSKTDNVGTPIQTSYPSRSRRSLSFRNDGVTRRVASISTSLSDVRPPLATLTKVTQLLSNTSDEVHVNPIPDNQEASLTTPIAPSLNDACTEILAVQEDLEPDDENLLDEEDEEWEEGIFDLNEPPEQQRRKNLKTRKKHRPKVFREGRPYRRRKPKITEEGIAKKKASEGKVGEKPRGRRKGATTALKSDQGDLEKQGSHSTPVDASFVPEIAGCAQCQENKRIADAERCTYSQGSPQTPVPEYVLVRGPNNSLIGQRACSLHAPDCSPLSTTASASPNLSRKRVGEDDRLIVADSPVSQRVRRELFKRARSKRNRPVVERGLGLGDKSQESLNEATVNPTAKTGEAGRRMRTDAIHSQELVHLESQERSIGEALVNLCSIDAEVAGTIIMKGWNPSNSEKGVWGESQIISTEVGTILPVKLRAAARAKSRHANLPNRGKKAPSRRSSSTPRRLKKQIDSDTMLDQVMNGMANLELTENDLQLVPHVNQQTAMVPYDGPFMPLRRKKPRAKVMLDGEDKRVWRLLMAQGTSFEDDHSEKDPARQWEEERATMKARAEKFINRMHLVQGDRRFSVWKGSVVDSVVGAFLTQNVSDHLSSSAFMCLASRFPVPRKKKAAAESSQETCFEVQVEKSFEVSQKASDLPVSSDGAEAVEEGSITAFHVEDVLEISEKSSTTGGGSSTCCNRHAQDHTGTEWHNYAEQRPTDVREQNSSCSSKDSQSQCYSCVYNATSHAGESFEVRESEQQKTCGVVEDFAFLHSGPEDVLASLGHSHVNSISSTALVDVGEKKATRMALPSSNGWIQTDSELLEGSLIVDLSLTADDLVMHTDQTQESICNGLHSLVNNPRTHGTRGNSVRQEKICSSILPGLEVTCASAEEVAASSGSVVSSSDSVDVHKLSETSVIPGSEVCATGEEIVANTAGVIFPLDSFDTNNSYDKQLVISSAADTDNQIQRDLSCAMESSNLHTLKSLIRKALKKKGPDAPDVNGKNNSELVTSTSDVQGKEGRGRGRGPVLGLTGIDRARLEESNITSKVAFDWEAVRLKYTRPEMGENQNESAHAGCKSFGSSNVENGVDWDAVRSAKLEDIADVIKERGMNNVLAGRIKAFLERVQKEHGSVDLEWLRTVSVEEAKSFLLSVRGLGLKSVECIRLLTLHHLAFPVDTNVGRICVRLGWVPLEPLPEELQLHLLELYPVQETIQKYLWPRLCSLDQRTLYELHYQMITFGKVFCTKSRPNCNACPMRDDCRHFASALASARLALPGAAHEDSHEPLALPAAAAEFVEKAKLALPALEEDDTAGEEGAALSKLNSFILSQKPCEPIVEEPSTPEPVIANCTEIEDIEEFLGRDEEHETFFGVSSQPSASEKGSTTDIEIVLPPAEVLIPDTASKALVCLPPGSESIPVPKLKNVGRLRTVHYVYELPDNHPLVQEMDPREDDDPCVYLLAIWSPGESLQAPPVLDDMHTNGTCDGFNGSEEETVKGTVLVPCRTAMRGIFPLNGTYFQVNEVFADHASSLQPIEVPRTLLWNLRRRFVYFGTSVTTIFKGLSTEEIQACFWRGYVCVRGFDSVSRCPRPLAARLHFPASKMMRKTKEEKNSDEA